MPDLPPGELQWAHKHPRPPLVAIPLLTVRTPRPHHNTDLPFEI